MRSLTWLAACVWLLAGSARADWRKGDTVEVHWKGQWYKAAILEQKDPKYRVHYDGFEASWDEDVGLDRIRPVGGWKVKDVLEVEWKGAWYKASVLEIKDGKYKVHYADFEASWDEFVPPSRMRKL